MSEFQKLVRFVDTNGTIRYGEAPDSDVEQGDTVPIYAGDVPWSLSATENKAQIGKILCPLPFTPIIYGIGLNYKTHIAEAGFAVPEFPTVFTKPPGALNGPYEDVSFASTEWNMDYEGELCMIIGKDCKDVAENEDLTQYILGYACGNDISARYWQIPSRSGSQHGYAKSFDGFAPIGPIVVSPKIIPNVGDLILETRVNGEVRQRSSLDDLLFSISSLIVHLSRGTTLKAGTVIMTGTPSGVGAFLKPPQWLKNGDEVEVEISSLGILKNTHNLQP